MFGATLRELARHGVAALPEAVLADAGYWHTAQMHRIAERGIEVLISPDGTMREGKRPGWENGLCALMHECLPPGTAASSKSSARERSSRSTGRSNTTVGSTVSREGAGQRHSRSGGWWQQPAISSSSTATGSRTPPERRQLTVRRSLTRSHRPGEDHRSLSAFSDGLSPKRSRSDGVRRAARRRSR